MNRIEENFTREKNNRRSSMKEHMETLRDLATDCSHVTEFGVNRVGSTWAFVLGCKGKVVSYDIRKRDEVGLAEEICKEEGIDWTFIMASDLEVEIEPTDMLFIDTLHCGTHLTKELNLHEGKVKKYIVMHDTVTFGYHGQVSNRTAKRFAGNGLWEAVEEFMKKGVWKIKKHYTNCHGLTILERV